MSKQNIIASKCDNYYTVLKYVGSASFHPTKIRQCPIRPRFSKNDPYSPQCYSPHVNSTPSGFIL